MICKLIRVTVRYMLDRSVASRRVALHRVCEFTPEWHNRGAEFGRYVAIA